MPIALSSRSIRRSAAVVFALATLGATVPAYAHGEDPGTPGGTQTPTAPVVSVGGANSPGARDKVQNEASDAPKKEDTAAKLPWHDTTLLFDQSVSTETVGVGKDYQSRNPSYQIWVSARPRYYFYEDKVQNLNLNLRFDYYKTLTNGEELPNGADSTQRYEDVFGDIRVNLEYGRKLYDAEGWTTTIRTGPNFQIPVSNVSRAAGSVLSMGASLGARQDIPILRGSDWLSSFHVGASVSYLHTFRSNTTAEPTDFTQERIAPDGTPLDDHQLSGRMLTEHTLFSVLETGLRISPKLSFTADMIWWSKWRYAPTNSGTPGCADGYVITIQNGTACASASNADANPPNYALSTWFVTSLDYQILNELALSLGYYTLTDNIAPDGTHQSFLWAPNNSRFFFSATISVDELFQTIRGDKATSPDQGTEGRKFAKATPALFGEF